MYRYAVAFSLMIGPAFAQEVPAALMENYGGVSSQVAFTPETLALLRDADSARGGALHGDLLCSSCHGDQGVARSINWPNLAGQITGYTYKSLYDYHTWERTISEGGPLMGYVVEELTPQDMADLARFYADLPDPAARPVTITQDQIDIAQRLHLLGDPERLIQPCSACHGMRGAGVFPDYPLIAGQTEGYLRNQLLLYRSGERHSDVFSRMRLLSAELNEQEIDALARYFAGMSDDGAPTRAGE